MSFSKQESRGSITLVALSLAIVIGISLGSYIALCYQAQQFSTRTIQLSRARHLAESSMEEALWALNNNNWTLAPWTIAPTANDRELVLTDLSWGEGVTGITNILVEKFDSSNPIITATGEVTVPGLGVFRRTLRATTKPAPLFANAIGIVDPQTNPTVASGTFAVKFSSSGLVDSWDSDYAEGATPHRNSIFSTAYPGSVAVTTPATILPSPYVAVSPPSNTYPTSSFNFAAVIAAPNITLNDAEIRGYAATFGNSLTVTAGSRVSGPPLPGTPPSPPPIEYGRVSKSAFVPTFTVAIPNGNSGNLNPTYTTNSSVPNIGSNVWYAPSGLEVFDPANLGVTLDVSQPTVIVVQGDLNLHHAGKIRINPPNGRLEIFVQGNVTVGPFTASTAGFQNATNDPKKLALYCTSPTRVFQYQSTQDFCGVIYSSSTTAKIQFLPANPNPVIFGAILAKYNVELDSGINPLYFHYDTALQYLPKSWFKGVTTPFIIVQVTEL